MATTKFSTFRAENPYAAKGYKGFSTKITSEWTTESVVTKEDAENDLGTFTAVRGNGNGLLVLTFTDDTLVLNDATVVAKTTDIDYEVTASAVNNVLTLALTDGGVATNDEVTVSLILKLAEPDEE